MKLNRKRAANLKEKVNALITANNAEMDTMQLPKIIGDYSPGYIYGGVKTHKPNSPLTPIISQIPTPEYQLSKKLNNLHVYTQ